MTDFEATVNACTNDDEELAEHIRDAILSEAASASRGMAVMSEDLRRFGIDGYVDLIVVARLIRKAVRKDIMSLQAAAAEWDAKIKGTTP